MKLDTTIPCDRFANTLLWSPDGKYLASVGMKVELHSPASKKSLVVKSEYDANAVAWSPDGKHLGIVGSNMMESDDVFLQKWSLEKKAVVAEQKIPVEASDRLGVDWSPDGERVVCWEACGGGVQVFDAATWTWQRAWAKQLSFEQLRWSPNGSKLAGIGFGKLLLLDAATGKKVWRVTSQPQPKSTAIAWSPDGKTLATPFGDKVRLGDAVTGKQVGFCVGDPKQYVDELEDGIVQVAFSNDGKLLAGASQHSLFVWDVRSKKTVATQPGFGSIFLHGLAFHPKQKKLAVRRLKQPIEIWSY